MSRSSRITRREALERVAMTAFAQGPTFPKGAIIRTLLKDYAPEELAGGATLFHEHMSLAPDFNDKFRAATAAARARSGSRGSGKSDAGVIAAEPAR